MKIGETSAIHLSAVERSQWRSDWKANETEGNVSVASHQVGSDEKKTQLNKVKIHIACRSEFAFFQDLGVKPNNFTKRHWVR